MSDLPLGFVRVVNMYVKFTWFMFKIKHYKITLLCCNPQTIMRGGHSPNYKAAFYPMITQHLEINSDII